MYGADRWGFRIKGGGIAHCELGGYYIIGLGMMKADFTLKEWPAKIKKQARADYKEITERFKNRSKEFEKAINLKEYATSPTIEGDCRFLVTPRTTLIKNKTGKFVPVKTQLSYSECKNQNSEEEK